MTALHGRNEMTVLRGGGAALANGAGRGMQVRGNRRQRNHSQEHR